MSHYVKLFIVENYRIRKKSIRRLKYSTKFVENEVVFAMWFMYESTENIIAEFKEFYDTKLSDEEKKKFFIPTYDCMKKYHGTWHIEQKPVFQDCFFIECKDQNDLQDILNKQQWSSALKESIISGTTALLSEQEKFLRDLMKPDVKTIPMSTGYIENGVTHVTEGPLQGKEKLICRIDRHKRLAKLKVPLGIGRQQISAGLEIISKS